MDNRIYYYTFDGAQQVGPVSKQELQQAGVNAQTQVWADGMPAWVVAGQVPALADLFPVGSPPPMQSPPAPQVPQAPQQYAQQAAQPNYNQTNINVNQAQKSNGAATAGLVCSLIGLLLFPWLLGLLGIIFSIVGLNKSTEEYSGRGAAVAGLIIGIIDILWGFVWFAVLANMRIF
jgi:hypothetical protein